MSKPGSFVSGKTALYIRQLHTGKDSDRIIRVMGRKRAYISFSIVCLFLIVSIPVFVSENERLSAPLTALYRNEYGEGDRTVTLRAETDGGGGETVTVNVSRRRYSTYELEDFSKSLDDNLWTMILGTNTDPENVVSDLDLKKNVDGYPFDISWKSDRPLILSSSGRINTKRLSEEDPENEGVNILLCATLKYGDFCEDKYSYVTVYSFDSTKSNTIRNDIERSIKESDEKSADLVLQELPKYAGDERVRFHETGINRGWIVLSIGIVSAGFYIAAWDEKIKKKALERKKQIELDYPNILNQYMLYYLAGMNPRTIWYKMCDRYERREGREEKRYLFEEMVITKTKMDEGLGELAAYDDFAKRCDSIRIRTFVSLIKQAVVKGSDGLDRLLYEEAQRARTERINRVKAEASEASTKLLLPMFMMLLVVLATVMIPAFIGLNG